MNVDELINKLQNTLNKLINENDLSIKTIELSNELLETLKITEKCTSCKDKKIDRIDFDKIEKCLDELEEQEWVKDEEYIIDELNDELFEINIILNEKILCEGCKRKIEELTDKCGNEEIARFLYYDCELNAEHYYSDYIRWVIFDEFKNIEYLAKGGFGEVHKATWVNRVDSYYNQWDVVLKRIYNNSSDDKIVDILKEVK